MSTTSPAREKAVQICTELDQRVCAELEAAADPVSDVYIGWFAAVDVAVCAARYRAGGAQAWTFPGWSPPLAAAAVGRAALGYHLHSQHRPTQPPGTTPVPPPEPVGAVRAWMQAAAAGDSRPPVAEWVTELLVAKDRATLAATAAGASRWLGGFVRVLGWPLPDNLGMVTDDLDNPVAFRWRKKHRIVSPTGGGITRRPSAAQATGTGPVKATCTVTVAGSPDAVLGKVTAAGTHQLVIHRPSAPTDTDLVDRAAFEAMAAASATGLVPSEVLFTLGDTGERTRIRVDAGLLDRGLELIESVVRQRVIATSEGEGPAFADANPSPTCRYCDHLDRCGPGRAWLDDPARRHGGLPSLVG